MTWKAILRQLELKKDWDTAIEFMQNVIYENPDDMDAYIYMNYLLMNLLVEEDHNSLKHDLDYYAKLAKYYFDVSYSKYSENAEYLFFTAKTAFMSEWFFGLNYEEVMNIYQKAFKLAPNNPLYQLANVGERCYTDPLQRKEAQPYAKMVLQENSPIIALLKGKGALGEYLLEITTGWAHDMLSGKNL